LPKPGETVLGGDFARFHGGKGANQALAAARAGAKVAFIGAHGNDSFGSEARAALAREGIDTRYFGLKKNASSGVALILMGGKSNENLIGVSRSANNLLSPEDVQAAKKVLSRSRAVVSQLEIPLDTVEAAAILAVKHSVPFILNPAPATRLPQRLFKLIHTLTPNEHEASLLTGVGNPRLAARALLQRGCKNVVVTLGAKGALLSGKKWEKIVPAPRVKPVDTVGAGDCFTAWLAVGVAEGLGFEETVRRAVKAASLSVTRPGAQAGMPYRSEV
jgi:ribokinase